MNAAWIECYGAYSCYKAQSLLSVSSSSSGYVWCWGLSSCAKAGIILTKYGGIECSGERSCAETTMINLQEVYGIYCRGDSACAHSTIISVGYHTMDSNLAAFNTTFIANDTYATDENQYLFFGFQSGYNATIICNNHEYGCNVECYGNGCVGLTLECVNGTGTDDCPMFEVDCDYAQYDEIICPDGYTLPSDIDEMPSLLSTSVGFDSNYDENICNLNIISINYWNFFFFFL